MKKLATLVLCALMLFSAVMPVTTLAKTKKCTHKNTTWVTTSKYTVNHAYHDIPSSL